MGIELRRKITFFVCLQRNFKPLESQGYSLIEEGVKKREETKLIVDLTFVSNE